MSGTTELMNVLVKFRQDFFAEESYLEDVKQLFKANCNGNKQMDNQFFQRFITSKVKGLNEIQVAGLFNIFDRKKRGIVSFTDFQSIFNQISYDKMKHPFDHQMKDNQSLLKAQKSANLGVSTSSIHRTHKQIPKSSTYLMDNPSTYHSTSKFKSSINLNEQQRNYSQKILSEYNPSNKNHLSSKSNQVFNELDLLRFPNASFAKINTGTSEDSFNSLLFKLAELRQRHHENKIDLFKHLGVSSQKKISSKDLIIFLGSVGINLTSSQSQILQYQLSDASKMINIKEFYKFIGIKSISQNQSINQTKSSLFGVASSTNETKQETNYFKDIPRKSEIPLTQPQLNKLKSSIQTNAYFEIEDSEISGFKEFVKLFKLASNKIFSDQIFQANDFSLQKNYAFPTQEWAQIQWVRTKDIFKGQEFKMFIKIDSMASSRVGLGKLISPNDIKQGILGDCYLLSALSSLAVEPLRILNLFITRIVNPFGIYCVKICKDGEWKAVYVDDQIPCLKGTPAFTKANDNELWVLILEKAWAKLFKSYANIETGFSRIALRDLTGAPTTVIPTQIEKSINGIKTQSLNEEIPEILKKSLNNNNKFVVTAGAESKTILTKSAFDRLGLINDHAYSVIGIKNVMHPKLGKVTLVKLRNPWGRLEWKGDWSDSSSLWTEQLRDELRIPYLDDGVFYMQMDDFQKFFCDICVCYYQEGYKYSSFRVETSNPKNSHYFRLKIKQAGTYYISIIQPNKRNFRDDFHYKYSVSRLFLCRERDSQMNSGITYIGAIQKKDRELFLECQLQPGNYLLQTKVFWDISPSYTYVVSSFGIESVKIEQIKKYQIPFKNILKECLLQQARQSKRLREFEESKQLLKLCGYEIKEGFGYYYVRNDSDKTAELEIQFIDAKGIKIIKPFRLPLIKYVILPKSEFIVPLTVSSLGFSFNCKEKVILK